ncbi:MAG: hypothetical protein IJJ40_04225 [Clostridia bacterium]|nr:hypothetical protein [Clostridia bacterium]
MVLSILFVFILASCGNKKVVGDKNSGEVTVVDESLYPLYIKTEGMGQLAYAKDGGEIVFDEEHPTTSITLNISGENEYTISAKGREGYHFTKWTKDNIDYSFDNEITVQINKKTEFTAYFEED